jgi:hypothetical protein
MAGDCQGQNIRLDRKVRSSDFFRLETGVSITRSMLTPVSNLKKSELRIKLNPESKRI